MATKINPDFYGTESSFVDVSTSYLKRSPYSIADLFTTGRYTGGAYDTTATPWGCGKSCFTSNFTFISAIGQNWLIDKSFNKKKNTPFYMYSNRGNINGGDTPWNLTGADASYANYTKCMYKFRTSPEATYNSGFKSTLTLDSGANIAVNNAEEVYPVTYADYQHLRVVITDVFYKPVGSNRTQKTTMAAIKNGSVSVDKIVSFNVTQYSTNNVSLALYMGTGGAEIDIPEIFRQCYYEGETKFVRPTRYARHFGYWGLDSGNYFPYTGSQNLHYASSFATPTSSDIVAPYVACSGWGQLCLDNQEFDDVSYHWECGMYKVNTSDYWDTSDKIENGDTYQQTLCASYAYMEFDDDGGNRNMAAYNAILHEVAFIGLPFVTSNDSTILAKPIGDDAVFLPVFDDHMITTGNFKNGAASLELPNATWENVFADTMPEYDPEYEPDEPIPTDDYGDTNNLGSVRATFPNGFKVYLMSANTYYQFLQAVNSYYNDKTPDDWTVDFQGVNPSDYILNCYTTKLALPHSLTGESIKIGNITLNVSAYTLSQSDVSWCTFDYGTRIIEPRYNDFRDYAPYTSAELYLPLAGTVDLDINYCMGHSITIKYYYDVLTMSCVAAVYRDNMLYKCADCKIGAEIPLLSSNMGSYQNQIEQLSVARQRNNIAIATSGAAAIAGTTAAIATGSPMAIIGAAGGFSKLAGNIIESNNLDYQFDHIAPSVSTTGASDPQNNLCVGQLKPKLIIKRPVMLSGHNDTIYSKTVGNACCINDYIGSRTGLVVCSNINANDIVNTYGESPTADEINSIKQAFANGVYV